MSIKSSISEFFSGFTVLEEFFLNIDVDNQFANAIKEEILEKLKYRWDVKEIEILFHH